MATLHGQALETALQEWVTNATSLELRYLSGYTPDPDDLFWSDISANEASGAPTPTLAGTTVSYDSANNRVTFDFTDPSDSGISTTTDGFAIIDNTGVAATSEILFTGTFTEVTTVAGTLGLTLSANGLFAVNAALT